MKKMSDNLIGIEAVKQKLKEVRQQWEAEVAKEQIRLIENGVPPWVAAEKANENVSEKRKGTTTQQFGLQNDE